MGTDSEIAKKFEQESFDHVIDATGCCVIPGLVDAHTHPVWAGDRVHEFAMKLAGATYMDVHKVGGGWDNNGIRLLLSFKQSGFEANVFFVNHFSRLKQIKSLQ